MTQVPTPLQTGWTELKLLLQLSCLLAQPGPQLQRPQLHGYVLLSFFLILDPYLRFGARLGEKAIERWSRHSDLSNSLLQRSLSKKRPTDVCRVLGAHAECPARLMACSSSLLDS
jgi:hypothetical protein